MYTRQDDIPIIPIREDYLSYQSDGRIRQITLNSSDNNISLPLMISGFLLLSIILTIVFFFLGPKQYKLIMSLAGFGLGIIISILIWFLWGKNNYKM